MGLGAALVWLVRAVGLVLHVSGLAVVSGWLICAVGLLRWLVCAVGLCVALGRLCRAGACFFASGLARAAGRHSRGGNSFC